MDGFEYEVAIRDDMVAPAKREKDALDELTSSLGKNEAALKKQHEAGHEAAEGHKEAGHGAGVLSEALGGLKESLVPQIAIGEMVAGAIEKVGEAALEAAKKLSELVIEGTKFAIEMSEFKENAEAAYAAVTGTAEEGEETFRAIDKLANAVHMPSERAHDIAKTLMIEGLENQQEVTNAITVISDLHRIGLEKGAEKFQSVVERSLQEGHFALPKRGGVPGVEIGSVYEKLASDLHISTERVKAELKDGKISAEEGIGALESVFMSSKAHEIAKEKFDLTDAVTSLKNSFRAMFQDVDTGPLKRALVDFVSIFDQGNESGKAMKEVITDTFNTVIRWVSYAVEAVTLFALNTEAAALNAEAEFYPFLKVLSEIKDFAESAAEAVLGIGKNAEGLGGIIDKLTGMPGVAGTQKHVEEVSAPIVKREAAHAEGGMVHEPPPGEVFAAVKPGEIILPEHFDWHIPNLSPGTSSSPGRMIHIDVGGIHIQGGANDDHMTIVEGAVSDMFERIALELGR